MSAEQMQAADVGAIRRRRSAGRTIVVSLTRSQLATAGGVAIGAAALLFGLGFALGRGGAGSALGFEAMPVDDPSLVSAGETAETRTPRTVADLGPRGSALALRGGAGAAGGQDPSPGPVPGVEPSAGPAPSPAPAPIRRTPPEAGRFAVQVGAYPTEAEAEAFVRAHEAALPNHPVFIIPTDIPERGTWYRVRIGALSSRESAEALRARLPRELSQAAMVVSHR